MNLNLIYPMAAMVLLSWVVLIAMFRRRVRAVRSGETSAAYYKTYQEGREPREIAQFSRHFINLFESPTLFYAACISGLVTGLYPALLVALAWLYVLLRHVHAWVHTGKNKIPARLKVYFTSWLVLLGMWLALVIGVATSQ